MKVDHSQNDANAVPELSTDALFQRVHAELRAMAQQFMGGERSGHTLQATALVNELYLRFGGGPPKLWKTRAEFFGAAARSMRHILVDHARAKGARKRGTGAARAALSIAALEDAVQTQNSDGFLALDDVLSRFEKVDPRAAEVVLLRFYAGRTKADTAELLGISERTVDRDWEIARAWLLQALLAEQKEGEE